MFREIKPPSLSNLAPKEKPYNIFLAGTIDLGHSVDWQDDMCKKLNAEYAGMKNRDIVVYNPRRDSWDASWKQSLMEPNFVEQVNWELDHLEKSHLIAMNIVRESSSIISMMELGLFAGDELTQYNADTRNVDFIKRGWTNAKTFESVRDFPKKIIVHCPDGFHRKGNVDVVCQRYGILQAKNEEELLEMIKAHVDEHYFVEDSYRIHEAIHASAEEQYRGSTDTSSGQRVPTPPADKN